MTLITPHIDAFTGTIITPDHPAYDEARAVYNGAIDRRPKLIAQARSTADVVAALRYARANDVPFVVRGGGHSVAGHSIIDDGLVIDMGPIRHVDIDLADRRAHAGAGLQWGELDAATQAHALAVTGGRVSHTGVAGLTLGSGSGWLERRHGLTADSLVGATVVTAEGDVVRASADEHLDLFWGLRGGGGNFAIVTEFEFQLHEVGPTVIAGMLMFPWERAQEVLAGYRDVMESAPDDLCGCAALQLAPPAPFVPEHMLGRPALAIIVAAFGPPARAAGLVDPLRALEPVVDVVQPMPYSALQRLVDDGNPHGLQCHYEASFMDSLSDDAIAAALGVGERIRSPFTVVLLEPLGGAFGRVPEGATALSHRDARWIYHALSQWPDPEDTPLNRAWTQSFVDALAPYARRGVHPNYVSDDRQDRVRSFYGEATYERLVAVKNRWDPDNVFCRNMNIRPS